MPSAPGATGGQGAGRSSRQIFEATASAGGMRIGRSRGRLTACTKRMVVDPANSASYDSNLAAFDTTMSTKEAAWASAMGGLKGAAVIGYHSTFDYFANAYGLNVIGFVEPKPGIPPTPQHTLELSATAKSSHARFVLVEPFHNGADAGPIASASGARVTTLPSSVGGATGVASYFDLFDTIVRTLTTGA